MIQIISYDTLQIILDFADPVTRAMISREHYKKLYLAKKQRLYDYMKSKPDNGLARTWLITDLFYSERYTKSFNLCRTAEHYILFMRGINTKNSDNIHRYFNNPFSEIDGIQCITRYLEDIIFGIYQEPHFEAMIKWIIKKGIPRVIEIISDNNIPLTNDSMINLMIEEYCSYRVLRYILKVKGSLESYGQGIAKNIMRSCVDEMDDSLISALFPWIVTDPIYRIFPDTYPEFCLRTIIRKYPDIFDYNQFGGYVTSKFIDDILRSTSIPQTKKEAMILDRYHEILIYRNDVYDLLKDMPITWKYQVMISVGQIKTMNDLHKKIEDIEDKLSNN